MKQSFKDIQLVSPISKEEQELWTKESEEAIKAGIVEPLSPEGLFEVIDKLGHTVATEAFDFVQSFPDRTQITEKDILESESNEIETMANIHFMTALASGIHPSIIYDLVDLRVDHYANEYIKKCGG